MVHPRSSGYRRDHSRELIRISRTQVKQRDSAVSPVVGIMLMITITLILAAIISGMTGGIAQSQKKPPQMVFESSVVIDGANSFLDIRVISVSEGILTRDLKFQTEWKDKGKQTHRTTVTPNQKNVGDQTYPLGYGTSTSNSADFGNYTLLAGTRLNANATTGAMDAVLTDSWDSTTDGITDGTPVRIQFIHVPSGAIIADKEITAEV